eukprot:CAMPEP_0168331244 /NCGR_PEP_ID=MMETSP0213-20121227/8215_1 /TAXON_ID=151035 /ORGANISM="Euplotes harpa, Strain FSP1.4" /LENGTH=73 /DNA_ID=CAMNT_0008334977 /DNA_START=1246 /DNA_END=1467 /DNA_ORIENTATION=-
MEMEPPENSVRIKQDPQTFIDSSIDQLRRRRMFAYSWTDTARAALCLDKAGPANANSDADREQVCCITKASII